MPRSERAKLIDFVKLSGVVAGSRKSGMGVVSHNPMGITTVLKCLLKHRVTAAKTDHFSAHKHQHHCLFEQHKLPLVHQQVPHQSQ